MPGAAVDPIVVRREPTVGVGVADDRVEREPPEKGRDAKSCLEPRTPHGRTRARFVEHRNRVLNVGPVLVALVGLFRKRIGDEDGPSSARAARLIQIAGIASELQREHRLVGNFHERVQAKIARPFAAIHEDADERSASLPAHLPRGTGRRRPSRVERTRPASCWSGSGSGIRRSSGRVPRGTDLRARRRSDGTAISPRRSARSSAGSSCLSSAARCC